MSDQNPSVEVLEKDVDWSSQIGVNIPVAEVDVYQRVEKFTTDLLEGGVLRIETLLKLFAVAAAGQDEKQLSNRTVFTNTVEINSFISLNAEVTRQDIASIDHQIIIRSFQPRPDKIIVLGTLRLKIAYLVHLVLDGMVTNFLNGSPLPGLTINVKKMEDGTLVDTTTSGSNGRYFFNNLPPGIYLVEATGGEYETAQKLSVINTRDTVDFIMHK